ncbi:MAG: hypothetical protein KA004_04050 [Verrucomicrobiales bacterium]|nr:hypothetical protein [Verrucomicrobiales bacterium]
MKYRFFAAALLTLSASASLEAAPAQAPASTPPAPLDQAALLRVWKASAYQFTPAVKQAWLSQAKDRALKEINAAGKSLPADFLTWIDGDPVVQATVYGARQNAANVLLLLRSLEIDLGQETVRKQYTNLALAMAVVHADKGPEADLSPRGLLKMVIPGDPRVPVDTADPKRKPDRNDHIINFLKANTVVEDVVVGQKEEPPPLKYDDKGIAIPPAKNAKPVKVPIIEKRTRTLYAADVLASRALQEKFNVWMKERGEDVSIDCGDQVVSWKSTAAVRAERKLINDAFVLFRTAYEEKGLLPKARDASPTPAESAAWWIRNDAFRFPADKAKQRGWPKYPLNAPWPTLTLLAADNQPLREREERWVAFRDKGEMRTYGEYIGPIAQQFDMQSARRLSPHAFYYNTYQMMAKDGGVCGTMANMGVRTYNTLGMPSCTAGQPGHCALIRFSHDPKTGLYECVGGQFATGGPEKTHPHTPWVFSDTNAKKPMIYYQTVGWAVNHGLQSYLDSTLAWQMFRALPEAERAAHGLSLLSSGFVLNPYNILITDALQAAASNPVDLVKFQEFFQQTLAGVAKPGCPKDGLYNQTVTAGCFARIAKLPPPGNRSEAQTVLAALQKEHCDNAEALVRYQVALDGLDTVVRRTETAFKSHLNAARTESACALMVGTLSAVSSRISDKKQKQSWLAERWREIQGRENFLGSKSKILTDPCASTLAKLTRNKLPDATVLIQPVLDAVLAELKASVAGSRDPKACKDLAGRIGAVARQLKDAAQSAAWLQAMASTVKGREQFPGKNGKPQNDPCADTIAKLLVQTTAAAKP